MGTNYFIGTNWAAGEQDLGEGGEENSFFLKA